MGNNSSWLKHGKFVEYTEEFTYDHEMAPEHDNNINQHTLADLVYDLGFDESVVAELEQWTEQQIKLGVREFVRAFVHRLSHTLHGFCVLRALGYHAHIENNGKQVRSLRQIAKHFKCSHQYVDRLTKDLEKQLGMALPKALDIETKTYTMDVVAPTGWLTYGQAIKTHNITRKRLLKAINKNQLVVKPYKRGSKIVNAQALAKALANQ